MVLLCFGAASSGLEARPVPALQKNQLWPLVSTVGGGNRASDPSPSVVPELCLKFFELPEDSLGGEYEGGGGGGVGGGVAGGFTDAIRRLKSTMNFISLFAVLSDMFFPLLTDGWTAIFIHLPI